METFLAILLGIVAKRVIDSAKAFGIDPYECLVGLCLVAGCVYALYGIFVPTEVQQNIVSFIATTLATAVGLYETMQRINQKK